MMSPKDYDVIGIGIGPSNLSLAALLSPIHRLKSIFFERKKTIEWHPGLMLEKAVLQVSFVKDLVTLVDPTNKYSYLNFLTKHQRLYSFLCRKSFLPDRWEYEEYLQWVATQIQNLIFSQSILEVRYESPKFVVISEKGKYQCKNLVLGTGNVPHIPTYLQVPTSSTAFHSSQFLYQDLHNLSSKDVAIIGGGQSGSEICMELLNHTQNNFPNRLYWITRRSHFSPIDDSPYANEWYTPLASKNFFSFNEKVKKALLKDQKLSSDGVNESLLEAIYQRIYQLKYRKKWQGMDTRPYHHVKSIEKINDNWCLEVYNALEQKRETIVVDIVIFCTGYKWELPSFMDPLKDQLYLTEEENCVFNEDYSIQWEYTDRSPIFILNGAKYSRGVPDANLSLTAWRSAVVINSLLDEDYYPLEGFSLEKMGNKQPLVSNLVV